MTLLCLLSPAKRMEYRRPLPFACAVGSPRFAEEASRIAKAFKTLTPEQLRGLMGISEGLAVRAHAQYQNFSETGENADNSSRAALYAFHGDTYIGLNAYALDEASVARAQARLRILSGLYGILRPLDAIQPYRCEMGLPLAVQQAAAQAFEGAPSPAHWWRGRVRQALQEDIERTGARWLVNLASKEYMRAVEGLSIPLVEVVFAEARGAIERRLGMAEKRMRGAFAKYIVENDIRDIEQLKAFGESLDARGYRLASASHDSNTLRFVLFCQTQISLNPSSNTATPTEGERTSGGCPTTTDAKNIG